MARRKPVLNPQFWEQRYYRSTRYIHHSVFLCPLRQWREIGDRHERILERYVGDQTNIFDVGCGYGSLIGLMPSGWRGEYLGIDICRSFVNHAKVQYRNLFPRVQFECIDLIKMGEWNRAWIPDLAVARSVRRMIQDNVGEDYWNRMESTILEICPRLLILEYTPGEDDGELIERGEAK